MKRRLMRNAGRLVLGLLGFFDKWITGSNTGLSAEELRVNPYRQYAILRSRGRILRSYTNRGWLVLGFDEVQELFRDPRFGSDIRRNRFLVRVLRAASDGGRISLLDDPSLLNLDPPDHTRLRKLVSQGFVHKHIQSLAPRIESIVAECLECNGDEYDVMARLAKPLPAIVIAQLLGLPESDMEEFQSLSEALLGITVLGDDDKMAAGTAASDKLTTYFERIIDNKRKNPDQDLISALIAAEEDGDRLTAKEMYSTCVLLLVAGHETTTRLIGNGLYTLLQHPDQLAMLREDESLIPNAIEEMLRFEPPVQLMPRFATEDIVFHGKKISKDQLVIPVIASANRDELANVNADKFDIRRENIKHVAFGHGIHLCLGMSLARLEAKIALTALLRRYPEMRLTDEAVEWTSEGIVRGVDNLVIKTNQVEASAS